MFKIFGQVREILSAVYEIVRTLESVDGRLDRVEADLRDTRATLQEVSARVGQIEVVEDLILRQNEQLLGRLTVPGMLDELRGGPGR